jgi:RNA polymerase sigma-B factor
MSAVPAGTSPDPAMDSDRLMARNATVEQHLPLAIAVAMRYRGRGVPAEDLVQVASVGLIHAVDRYDPSRKVAFTAFAVPTIAGEIKRHFRDQGWHMRVPRRLQDLAMRARRAEPVLAQTLSRTPTAADIAAHLGERETDVSAALRASHGYRMLSIDAPAPAGADLGIDSILGGEPDPDMESVDGRITVRRLLARLPRRERRILWLRYFCGLTQSEIGATVGMSQVNVSRSLARSLRWLRELAHTVPLPEASWSVAQAPMCTRSQAPHTRSGEERWRHAGVGARRPG